METKDTAQEILDYCLSYLGIEINNKSFMGLKKSEYNKMLKQITFLIDTN